MPACVHCGEELAPGRVVYCSDACRMRVQRRRRAGLPHDAYQRGGRRGRVPLGQPTRRELTNELVSAQRR